MSLAPWWGRTQSFPYSVVQRRHFGFEALSPLCLSGLVREAGDGHPLSQGKPHMCAGCARASRPQWAPAGCAGGGGRGGSPGWGSPGWGSRCPARSVMARRVSARPPARAAFIRSLVRKPMPSGEAWGGQDGSTPELGSGSRAWSGDDSPARGAGSPAAVSLSRGGGHPHALRAPPPVSASRVRPPSRGRGFSWPGRQAQSRAVGLRLRQGSPRPPDFGEAGGGGGAESLGREVRAKVGPCLLCPEVPSGLCPHVALS